MNKDTDNSWDSKECSQLDLPFKEELFNEKFRRWEKRDWMRWLEENLSFPFTVKRMGDDDDAYFTDVAEREPFRLGHEMKVLALAREIPYYGIIVKVREKRRIGYVPLSDLEVSSKSDMNYWRVREYAVWFGNR